jgi:hypothetical protein
MNLRILLEFNALVKFAHLAGKNRKEDCSISSLVFPGKVGISIDSYVAIFILAFIFLLVGERER